MDEGKRGLGAGVVSVRGGEARDGGTVRGRVRVRGEGMWRRRVRGSVMWSVRGSGKVVCRGSVKRRSEGRCKESVIVMRRE